MVFVGFLFMVWALVWLLLFGSYGGRVWSWWLCFLLEILVGSGVKDKLKMLHSRKEAIAAKMQKLEAIERVAARKRELQKKILVGDYFLEQASKNGTMSELKIVMLGHLKRTGDRKLFEGE